MKLGSMAITVPRLPAWYLLPAALLFWIGLSDFPIYIVDEARNAQAAWEMLQAGEWIVPTFNDQLRADKPPLHYYGMRIGYLLLGKTAVAARLGSALCGMITLLGIYAFARRHRNRQSALLAAAIFTVGWYVPVQFHLATPDPYLVATFTLGQLCLFQGFTDRSPGWLLAGYGLLGLAVLAKGPVALVLAGGSWGLFLLARPREWWLAIRRLRPILGLLVVLVVAVPWYYFVDQRTNGEFTRVFFWEHNAERFLATKEGHGGSFLLIPAFVVLALLPFAFWLPQAILRVWRRSDRILQFALATAAAVIGFFLFSRTKLPSYPFPAVPFLALLVGDYLRRFWRKKRPSGGDELSFLLTALVLAALPAGAYFGLRADPVLKELSASWWHLLVSIPLVVVAVIAWYRARNARALGLLGLTSWLFQIYLLVFLLPQIGQRNQVEASLPLLRPAPEVIALGRFTPAYVFALDRPIESVDSTHQLRSFLAAAPDSTLVLTAERYRDRLPRNWTCAPYSGKKIYSNILLH